MKKHLQHSHCSISYNELPTRPTVHFVKVPGVMHLLHLLGRIGVKLVVEFFSVNSPARYNWENVVCMLSIVPYIKLSY